MNAGLRHHLTARGATRALIAVTATAVAMMVFAAWFKADPSLSEWWVPIEALGPLLAVTFTARTLAGIDVTLERSTARQRPALRSAHVLAGLLLCALPTTVAAIVTLPGASVTATIRNGIGFFGLVLLGGTIVRAGAGWMPVCGYALLVLAVSPRGTDGGKTWWAWFVQPGSAAVTWMVATVLLTIGAAAYVRRGPAG